MPVIVTCPGCNAKVRAPEALAHQSKLRCSACATVFSLTLAAPDLMVDASPGSVAGGTAAVLPMGAAAESPETLRTLPESPGPQPRPPSTPGTVAYDKVGPAAGAPAAAPKSRPSDDLWQRQPA